MERARTAVSSRLEDPVFWNDALQIAKTVLAAVVAWVLAAEVLHWPQPFLAPWSALLVVHATVYRTFSRGAQQIAATVLGVLVAAGAGQLVGVGPLGIALVLGVGLALGAIPWLGAEGTTLAATGLVVLTTGFDSDAALISRLLDTAIGIGVGLAVNLLVWPPLRRHTAVSAMDHIDNDIGDLLIDIAEGLGHGCTEEEISEWIDRTRDLDGDLDHAWSLVRQAQESARMNPRRSARQVRLHPEQWNTVLRGMEQAIAETRSMVRTLDRRRDQWQGWDDAFTEPWRTILHDGGQAISDSDSAGVHAAADRVLELAASLVQGEREAQTWPVQGALLTNLRNVLDSMQDVAAANPLGRRRPIRLHIPRRRGVEPTAS